jgi:hypothetical protein
MPGKRLHEKREGSTGIGIESQMLRFQRLARSILNVPPEELDIEREKYEAANSLKNKLKVENNGGRGG